MTPISLHEMSANVAVHSKKQTPSSLWRRILHLCILAGKSFLILNYSVHSALYNMILKCKENSEKIQVPDGI